MHIPDGFLSTATLATTAVISVGGVGNAVRLVSKKMDEKQVPLLGVTAAFTFAAQMLNFPIAGGTSGHFVGAALAAVLLGPWAAILIITCVLVAQCLLFQDGELLALGANILNMGIIGAFSSYLIYRFFTSIMRDSKKSRFIGAFAGAWASAFLASIAVAIELAVSGTSPLMVVLPAMAGVHLIIGFGEGLITVAVLSLISATRADLLQLEKI